MKKYIVFFISIGLLLGIVLFYNTINVEQSKKVTFNESGYILNSSTERYYFYQDETYTTSYNHKIVFFDTEGEKVTLNNDNFIHYSSGNIVALQEGVLLELSKIDDNPIIYYNVGANKEIKKLSNRYIVKNLDKDLQFEQAIWKISSTKYIILGKNIKIKLENGTEKDIEGYVEIEYSDNEVINIYNQELSYQTISSDSYIELDDDIKINLGTKIVSKKDENKMSLEDMVINSDDNVTLVDLNTDTDEKEENITEENEVDENKTEGNSSIIQSGGNSGSGSNSNSNSSTTTNSQSTIINQGNGNVDQGNTEKDENTIKIEIPDIDFEGLDEIDPPEVNNTKVTNEPKFKLENMKVTALSVKGTIKITDDDDLLSKDEDVKIKIINNNTGKTVYNDSVKYGTLSIPLAVETLLPNTQYTVIVSATYLVNETSYTKNFIYKTFVTSKIGIDVHKNGFTDNSMNFLVSFDDEIIKSAKATILDANGNEIPNMEKTIKNTNNETKVISFDYLQPDTKYKVKIYDIQYNGATQTGSSWVIYNDDCKTLKSKASVDMINYSIDKKDSKFKLYIEKITDKNISIQNYTYVIYEFKEAIDSEGKTTLVYDTNNIVYTRDTKDTEITVDVGNADDVEGIVRNKYYGFRVIANTYDNEKYVEIASDICGPFVLSGKLFPTVKFIKEETNATKIKGSIYISDFDYTLLVDQENPLTIMYKNQFGDEGTIVTIKDPVALEEMKNEEGIIVIPITLENLKSNTSYVLSVYGSIDTEDRNDYTNIFIGSAIVNTESYKELKVNLSKNGSQEVINKTFAVDVNIEGEDFEKDNLESISFIMQAGTSFKNEDRYYALTINNTNCSLYNEKASSLKELLCDNTLTLTPSMIGGGLESDYNEESYYTVLATVSVDGTNYNNEIPVKIEEVEDLTKTIEFIDTRGAISVARKDQKYTAAAIIAKTKGTTEGIPTNPETAVNVSPITNANANEYQLYDKKLADSTVVGYKVTAGFKNSGSRKPKSITYYAWYENGKPITDGKGTQLTKTIMFDKNSENTPSAVFEIGYGTTATIEEDNKSGLHRGGSYYFSYTMIYEDENGNEQIWPMMVDNKMDEGSLRSSRVFPQKQEPNFIMYPKTSGERFMTYIYSCYDYDKALNYTEEGKSTLELFALQTTQGEYEIDTDVENNEVTFNNLDVGITYDIRYKRIFNKTQTTTYEAQNLVTQKFQGVEELNGIRYTVISNDESKPNKLIINLSGSEAELSKIAGAVVTLNVDGYEEKTSLLKLTYDDKNKKYSIEVDLLKLSIGQNIINTEIAVNVSLYYDTDKFGYIPEEDVQYVAYMNTSDINNYKYMTIDSTGYFIENNSINGNMYYKQTLDTETIGESASLIIKDMTGSSRTLNLMYTGKGLMYGDNIIVPKHLGERNLTGQTVKIEKVIAGIKINSIETTVTEGKIKAEIINTLNLDIKDNKIYIDILELNSKNEIVNWENAGIREINLSNVNDFTLDGLNPAKYYRIRFKYKLVGEEDYTYMYDAETNLIGTEYQFETVATIGINNVDVKYEAITYKEKYLTITYNIDSIKSNMYQKIKYEFFDDENKKIFEEYVDNSIYNMSGELLQTVTKKINISPENNIFTFGETYKLIITPIINSDGTDIEIESAEKEVKLDKLKSPTIGLKTIRIDNTEQKYIRAIISITDDDKIIAGASKGEYTLKVYKYSQEDKSDKEEINIYDRPSGGNNITSNTFNIDSHGSNYSIYLQNFDFSYNYEIEMHYKIDRENNSDTKNQVVTKLVKKSTNSANIELGDDVQIVKNNNKVDVIFYNAYKITSVNSIEYTVTDNNNNPMTGSFKPSSDDWEEVTETEFLSYHKITLPIEFANNGTYNISLNLYKDKELIGQIERTYTYSSTE